MDMSILKDETTARLDETTRLADEALTFYEWVVGKIGYRPLHDEIVAHIHHQRAALRALMQARWQRDELPEVGDYERSHIVALLESIRQLLTDDSTAVIVRIAQANERVREAAASAAKRSLPPEEQEPIRRIIASCDSLDELLGNHAQTE